MLYDTDNSSDETQTGSSESDDDIETLLLDTLLTPNRELGPRLNLQDIEEIDCQQWFRYASTDIQCDLTRYIYIYISLFNIMIYIM